LRITDIHKGDDTLQVAASSAERTTPTVSPGAESDDDDALDDDLGGQSKQDSLIDNNIRCVWSPLTEKDRLDVATQNSLRLEMLLKNKAQWQAEHRLEWERMGPKKARMAAKWDQWAAECTKRTE